MKFKLKIYDFDKDISNIGFDVISDDDDLYDIIHEEFEELFEYDLSYLWEPPYEPIVFNMIIETDFDPVVEESSIIIYSDGVVE